MNSTKSGKRQLSILFIRTVLFAGSAAVTISLFLLIPTGILWPVLAAVFLLPLLIRPRTSDDHQRYSGDIDTFLKMARSGRNDSPSKEVKPEEYQDLSKLKLLVSHEGAHQMASHH